MDWKKVKLMLIVLFLFINIFLLHMLYNKNIKSYVDTIDAIKTVFNANNVTVIPNISNIEKNKRMSKILITGNDEITEDLLITIEEAEKYKHIGRKKSVEDITVILSNFIRDTAPSDLIIKNISLAYFFNSNQIGEEIVSGEAEPCWIIETNDAEYIYNAYSGELIVKN